MKDAILNAVTGVTNKWAKQRKAEERHRSASLRRRDAMTRCSRVTLREAAWSVMAKAYAKASGNGEYPANARQIMYAARGEILAMTEKDSFKDAYFTQKLLPEYIQENPDETADWDVAYDARGHFCEPHTGREVPLGTLEVRKYLSDVAGGARIHTSASDIAIESANLYPTIGPKNRYGAILFIEKEGFMPLFEKADIARRFDIGVESSKGQSVIACRKLADDICGPHDIPLLLLRDFDIAGFNIAHVLQTDTDRYTFENDLDVIDLGLRLDDVEKYGLASEPVNVPRGSGSGLQERGATPEEINFLCGGQRVELNAFASDDLVEWIEGKLAEVGIGKLVPKMDVMRDAYRRAARIRYVEDRISELTDAADELVDGLKMPRDLKRRVTEFIESHPTMPWDRAISSIVGAKRIFDEGL